MSAPSNTFTVLPKYSQIKYTTASQANLQVGSANIVRNALISYLCIYHVMIGSNSSRWALKDWLFITSYSFKREF